MAAHRKRPIPPARMVELLADAKRDLIGLGAPLTRRGFEAAWAEAWEVMVAGRAWPHATEHRRQWRAAMIATKSECRAAWLGQPTPFGTLAEGLTAASARWNFVITKDEIPMLVLGAIRAGYSATGADEIDEEDLVREEAMA